MRIVLVVVAAAVVAAGAGWSAAQGVPPFQVQVDAGMLSGTASADGRVRIFRGVPYAAPPVGPLRWRAPEPAAPWTGVRNAGAFSSECVQNIVTERKPWTEEFMAHGATSEDCLYLNVWTAAASASERRPVYVWLYGGGLVEGSGSIPVYDGEPLAREGLVVVNLNYRVGVFGYFAHPELTKESPHHASGNYGYLDQVAALQWVRRNIAAFGGDPARVTVGGQSAGAGSVHALTVSPLAKGLFRQAIAESGSGLGRVAKPLAEAEQDGLRFAATRQAGTLAALRALPASALAPPREADPRWGAVVDGWLLPDTIDRMLGRGGQNDVATLTGLTADEGSSATSYGKISAEDFRKQSREKFGSLADAFLSLYPATSDAEASRSQIDAARDQGLVSMYLWGRLRAKSGRTPLYTYYWNHAMPGPDRDLYRAFHTSEVPYVFNSLHRSNRPWEPADRAIAKTMSSHWRNFVTSGDPNGPGLDPWPAFHGDRLVTMELGDRSGTRPVADAARLKFYSQFFAEQER
jgi:para-nitrobenzyl esterase